METDVLAVNSERAFALDADEDDEGVELAIVDGHRLVEVVDGGAEVGTVHKQLAFVLLGGIVLAVVAEYGVVNALAGLLGMQLSQVAVLVGSAVVVDAVGDVAGLLYLCQIASGTDGVDASGRNEETVTLLDAVLCQGIADGVVVDHRLVLLRRYLHLQAVVELGRGG